MTIPSFRRKSLPQLGSKEGRKDRKRERFRGSRHERGYDADWTKLAARYKKAVKGKCEECERRGYLYPADVVDHLEPVRDSPDKRLDWNNLQALCNKHHAWKYKLEEYARKMRCITLLQQWCRLPETRPIQFQIRKRGPLGNITGDDP